MNASSFELYRVAVYWSVQTLSTVGYGDINANGTSLEMVLACIWMILGVVVQSYLIGNFIGIISSIDQDNSIIIERISSLKSFSKNHKIPDKLQYRIIKHIKIGRLKRNFKQSEQFMLQLPKKLRDQVIMKTHQPIFDHIKFFQQHKN